MRAGVGVLVGLCRVELREREGRVLVYVGMKGSKGRRGRVRSRRGNVALLGSAAGLSILLCRLYGQVLWR